MVGDALRPNWHGIYPAATTEYRDNLRLDLKATVGHVNDMIKAGIDGVIMLGTVGENTSNEYDEKLDVLKATVDAVDGRIPVLTGVAEYTTKLACRFSVDAQKVGVDGLMVLPAMVYKTDPGETLAHFRTVARTTDLPVMVYNNPVAYKTDITPEMFVELADEPTLAAIKESSEDVRRITDLRNLLGNRYILFSGVDDLALESMVLGVEGWVSGLVNGFPAESRWLWDLATAGRYEEARKLYQWFTPLLHLDTSPKLVQYIKLANAECDMGSEAVRPPRLRLEGAERKQILRIIRRAIKTRPAGPGL